MADKIRNFFSKKKIEKQFKKAGPGHRLSEESSTSSSVAQPPVPGPSASTTRRAPGPSETASRAGAAALARLGAQKDVNFSLAAIRAQALKELEMEKQQRQAEEARKASDDGGLPKHVKHQHKEVPPQLKQDGSEGLLFRCPMMGPQALPRRELRTAMLNFLREQLEEERGLSAALIIVTCNDDKGELMVQACVEILCKYLKNVIDNPDNVKFRKIKLTNKVFLDKVKPIVGAMEFLEAAGFVKYTLDDGECYLVLNDPPDNNLLPALHDALVSAEPMEIVLDRNPKVLLPSQSKKGFSVSDDFFTLSQEELAREQAERARDVELRTQLRTKAMRERDAKRESISYRYTCIRIRLPNGLILQGTFEVSEKLSEVVVFIRECLIESLSKSPIVLKSGANTLTAFDETLQDLKLFPAVVLNCIVTGAPAECDYIKHELIATVQPLDPL
ncbi:UBX domain-containing protein 6-like [Tropilaelaps mercedesae]|uniref:UBX domain-containing protein 6-like n=1 Tax=Tropilaelaps mercedesae TaxID=418985 RepID=A0A1V9Y027_9ACAR|nr:UBX domain-containing protein 6-like [Tropilaelaps mercedesae]